MPRENSGNRDAEPDRNADPTPCEDPENPTEQRPEPPQPFERLVTSVLGTELGDRHQAQNPPVKARKGK